MEIEDLRLQQESLITRDEQLGGGRMSRGGFACASSPDSHSLTSLPGVLTYPQVHGLKRGLTRTQTCSRTHDTHARRKLLVCLLRHNGRLGRMCARDHIFPPPFLAVWWVSVAHISETKNKTCKTEEAEDAERNAFAGGLKQQ